MQTENKPECYMCEGKARGFLKDRFNTLLNVCSEQCYNYVPWEIKEQNATQPIYELRNINNYPKKVYVGYKILVTGETKYWR